MSGLRHFDVRVARADLDRLPAGVYSFRGTVGYDPNPPGAGPEVELHLSARSEDEIRIQAVGLGVEILAIREHQEATP